MSLDADYFENLGKPKPSHPFGLIDEYRFRVALGHIKGKTLLDVGAYYGDLIKLARDKGLSATGTEVNQSRIDFCNEQFDDDPICLGFRNGSLEGIPDKSIDSVVCLEVMEHVDDNKKALEELCRVARQRVIISVPYEEKIPQVQCIHCNKYTPHSGHLHSYTKYTFDSVTPSGWARTKMITFGKKITRKSFDIRRNSFSRMLLPCIWLCEKIVPGKRRWIFFIFDSVDPQTDDAK